MPKKPLTVDDLWALPRVGTPAPSPDGSRLVVPVTTYDLDTDKGTTRLWEMPSDASKAGAGGRDDPAVALTTAEASSGSPAWSPDGTCIAFVRKPGGDGKKGGPKHGDQPQLYAIPVDGGEAERLTDLPRGVTDPKWFPDGKRISMNLKIDREFVSDIGDEHGDTRIVEAVTQLGHSFGLRVIAEGVEDAASLDVLKLLGCDMAQGFHLSRPVPLDALSELLPHQLPAA